jgi:hypothetical protein
VIKKIFKYFQENPHIAVFIVAWLCFMQFVNSLLHLMQDGEKNSHAMSQLLSSVDGLEAAILFLITLALQDKNK